MKLQLTLTTLLITLNLLVFGQTEKLNQLDANGKKHGTWIVWLDAQWNLAKDNTSAVYFRYNYFKHGNSCNPMGPGGNKKDRLEVKSNSNIKKGNALMLDGEYKWYNSKGQLIFEHVLKNGWYVSYKEYYTNGNLMSFFDYTQHYQDQQYSWLIISYNKKGEEKSQSWATEDARGKGVDN